MTITAPITITVMDIPFANFFLLVTIDLKSSACFSSASPVCKSNSINIRDYDLSQTSSIQNTGTTYSSLSDAESCLDHLQYFSFIIF